MNIPEKRENITITEAEIKYGFANLWKERPDDKIAVISVLFASLEVKKITARKRNTGYSWLPKYQTKSV